MSDFKAVLKNTLNSLHIELPETAIDQLCVYNDMLIEKNKVMNLTALTEPEDVALKHYADSLTLLKYVDIEKEASVIDVGTGAGFPGMVLKIARPDIRLTLLDSLNKRLDFLRDVADELGFDDIEFVHARAEDGSHTQLRENFDHAVSRAVAPMNVLCEYDLPYIKVGGSFIAMKGKDSRSELEAAENAVGVLGGRIKANHEFALADAGERAIIEIEKIATTPDRFPRKSKQIKSNPL